MSYHTLIQFRETVFSLFKFARDAAMNLLDALCSFDASSVIELSLSPFFERSHASVSRAIQDTTLDDKANMSIYRMTLFLC